MNIETIPLYVGGHFVCRIPVECFSRIEPDNPNSVIQVDISSLSENIKEIIIDISLHPIQNLSFVDSSFYVQPPKDYVQPPKETT